MNGKVSSMFTLFVLFTLLLGSLAQGISNQALAQQNPPDPPVPDGAGSVFLPVVASNMASGLLALQQVNVLSLTPESGAPGSQVYVQGTEFSADACGVNLYWDSLDGASLGFAPVFKGEFALTILVPKDAEVGGHTILGQVLEFGVEFCGGPSGEETQVDFQVTPPLPVIVLDTLEATPGSVVNVQGANFCGDPQCSTVDILIQGLPGALDVPVNEDGTFTAEAIIPGGTPVGTNPISAFQTDGQGNEISAYGEIEVWTRPNAPQIEPPAGPETGEQSGTAGLTTAGPLAPSALSPWVSDVNPDGLPAEPRFGGRALGLTISPANVNNVFVASELGGIWRSTDGAANWSHVDDVPLTISRDAMYDPQDANILIATGRYDARVDNMGGIWRSDDGGTSWMKPPSSNPACSNEASAWGIAIPDDAGEHNNIYVGTDCGLAVSDDSGASWTHIDPCPSGTGFCWNGGRIFDVEARVVDGDIQLDVCGNEGYFRSDDGGDTWTAPDPNSPSRTGVNPCHLATSPNDPDTVYLANWSGVNASGFCTSQLLESTSAGSPGSWVDMGLSKANCRDAWVVTQPALSGNTDQFEVYFGDSQRVRHQTCDATTTPRCTAGDANWPNADSGAHADPSDIAFDPANPGCPLVLSTDGGISTSSDCGGNWQDGNRGYHALDIADMAGTVEADHTDVYIGTQDNGLYFSQDNANTWSRPVGADVYNVMADHTPPVNVFYRQCFGCGDTIANAHLAGAGAFNDPPGTIPNFAKATQFGYQSYAFITNDGATPPNWTVYVTTDAGSSWNQMGPSPLPGNPGEIKASGPTASPTFYLRLNVGGVLRMYSLSGSFDSTATLTPVNAGLVVPTGAWDVDPSNPNLLYASDVGTDQMMFSNNGGLSWNPDPTLTNMATHDGDYRYDSNTYRSLVSAVGFDLNTNRILVGTRTAGLLASVTDGQAWLNVPGAEGLPLFRDFFFDESDGAAYLATRGRGIWRLDLPSADISVEKSDSPDPVAAGEQLVYTVEVANDGPDEATDVSVTDTLPPEVSYDSDTGGCVETPAGTLTCALGDIASGGSASFQITVKVAPDVVYNAGGPTTIINQVEVTSTTPDEDLSDNSASQDTLVVAVADLEIVSFEAVDPPDQVMVGEDVVISLRKIITNHGPSAPMDTELTKSATPPMDSTVTPTNVTENEMALGLDEMREVIEEFTISCGAASHHTFTFDNQIMPLHPEDTDPDLSNNNASLDLEIECVVPVVINIKPHSDPNSINPDNQGVIPLAVLTTSAGEYGTPLDFDATSIDPLSVRFGPRDLVWSETGGAFEAHDRGHIEDSYELDETTRDGDLDMVLHFRTQETGIQPTDTEACVKGDWVDGMGDVHSFFGCDAIRIVPSALP